GQSKETRRGMESVMSEYDQRWERRFKASIRHLGVDGTRAHVKGWGLRDLRLLPVPRGPAFPLRRHAGHSLLHLVRVELGADPACTRSGDTALRELQVRGAGRMAPRTSRARG